MFRRPRARVSRPRPTADERRLVAYRRAAVAAVVSAAAAAAAAAARPAAADVFWKANASGNYSTGSNWVGGAVPGSGSVADFAVAGGGFYTVSLTGNVTTAGIVDQAGDQPVLNLAGHTWTAANGSDDPLVVGPAANDFGILQVAGGTLVTTCPSGTQASLGRVANSAGYLYLDNGTTWTNNGDLYAGESGTGQLYVGGTNATAAATVAGTLDVGQNAGSAGSVSLYANSTLTAKGFENVGDSGNGSVYQTGGTHTVASNLALATLGSSTGYYELDGGTLAVAGYEFVGYQGTGGGTFIQNGGDAHRRLRRPAPGDDPRPVRRQHRQVPDLRRFPARLRTARRRRRRERQRRPVRRHRDRRRRPRPRPVGRPGGEPVHRHRRVADREQRRGTHRRPGRRQRDPVRRHAHGQRPPCPRLRRVVGRVLQPLRRSPDRKRGHDHRLQRVRPGIDRAGFPGVPRPRPRPTTAT